jgi:hypothetical protein
MHESYLQKRSALGKVTQRIPLLSRMCYKDSQNEYKFSEHHSRKFKVHLKTGAHAMNKKTRFQMFNKIWYSYFYFS